MEKKKEVLKKLAKIALKKVLMSKLIIIFPLILVVIVLLSGFEYIITLDEGILKEDDKSNVPYAVSDYINNITITEDGLVTEYDIQELWKNLLENGSNIKNYLKTPEELEKLINAEIVTQYPKIGKGKLDGIVEFKRADADLNVKNLKYVNQETFNSYIERYNNSGDEIANNYYTVDDDGNVLMSQWTKITTKVTTTKGESSNTTTSVQYSMTTTSINYKSVLQKYTMPFNYLWAILITTNADDFVLDLADFVLEDSQIEITGKENYTSSTDTQSESSSEEVTVEEIDPDTGEKTGKEETQTVTTTVTTETTVESNNVSANLTKADTWIIDYEMDLNGKEKTVIKDNPESEEDNFITILNKYSNAKKNIVAYSQWLFEILEQNTDTANMVDLTKYLLYKATGKDFGVKEFDFSAYDDNDFTEVTGYSSGNVLVEFLGSWENGAIRDYIIGKSSYTPYVARFITQDKTQYICYNDTGTTRNYGYGVCHLASIGGSYMHVSEYAANGIKIDSGNYDTIGVSKIDVEIVDNVKLKLLENMKSKIKRDLSKNGIKDLKEEQIDALTAVMYQYGNIGNFYEMYKRYGNTEDLRSSCRANGATNAYYFVEVKPGGDNAKRRAAANWKLFHEGIYTAGNGDILDPSSYSGGNGDFLSVAQNIWKKVCMSGQFTEYGGTNRIPPTSKRIDCSGYVSWVIYEYGYKEFTWQRNAQTYATTNWKAKYGWEEIDVKSRENPINNLRPGDILARYGGGTHHVLIVESIRNGKLYAYDCGNSNNWLVKGKGGVAIDRSYFLTSAGDGKIIRVTKPK